MWEWTPDRTRNRPRRHESRSTLRFNTCLPDFIGPSLGPTESAPIVTPGRIVAAAPIHTFVSMVIGSGAVLAMAPAKRLARFVWVFPVVWWLDLRLYASVLV